MQDLSAKFKIKMNRVFREQVGAKNIPHPEVDTPYERIRSKIIRICLLSMNRIKKKCSRR